MNAAAALGNAIDALLPQTQCRQCGYTGCRPYADAIAAGTAPINQCPPGGPEVIAELAALLGVPAVALDTTCGAPAAPAAAVIDESACIGCALCLAACPVDAIVGARRLMHTVIAAECTGCGLCVPPCPVDCIAIVPTGVARDRTAQQAASRRLRDRFIAHRQRIAARSAAQHVNDMAVSRHAAARRRAAIDRALNRARARLARNNN
ncbi:MAG: RnfABCDGE type electron transport complex subunit B [Betaproteobacteria bacterium]|nr:MAG: RnfABCDGE type electron transport complex subunit B [Betaproteobacteria bacterium]